MTWMLSLLWISLGLQVAILGLMVWMCRRFRQSSMSRELSRWSLPMDQHGNPEAVPGTTFLPDDAETARREASLKKASRERAGLIR